MSDCVEQRKAELCQQSDFGLDLQKQIQELNQPDRHCQGSVRYDQLKQKVPNPKAVHTQTQGHEIV
jgi:hypothetical protein